MKRFSIGVIAALATVTLSGCATPVTVESLPPQVSETATSTPAFAQLSSHWSNQKSLQASAISIDLTHIGICKSDDLSLSDIQEWADDTIRGCFNFHDLKLDSQNMTCPASLYITVGDGIGADGKVGLAYEDGYDVAMIYAPGWAIFIAPAGDIMMTKSPETALKMCESTISEIAALVGGSVTRFGQYEG